ncbi:hypothetical protein VNO78_11335 [Psophocarpus tetragonolobus]|uniref:Uncharacterized protein n=1 Tax=Psophocarpus tetragonolobus TaxID=3891 RepID=A0AAN9XNK7_PSOTE
MRNLAMHKLILFCLCLHRLPDFCFDYLSIYNRLKKPSYGLRGNELENAGFGKYEAAFVLPKNGNNALENKRSIYDVEYLIWEGTMFKAQSCLASPSCRLINLAVVTCLCGRITPGHSHGLSAENIFSNRLLIHVYQLEPPKQ